MDEKEQQGEREDHMEEQKVADNDLARKEQGDGGVQEEEEEDLEALLPPPVPTLTREQKFLIFALALRALCSLCALSCIIGSVFLFVNHHEDMTVLGATSRVFVILWSCCSALTEAEYRWFLRYFMPLAWWIPRGMFHVFVGIYCAAPSGIEVCRGSECPACAATGTVPTGFDASSWRCEWTRKTSTSLTNEQLSRMVPGFALAGVGLVYILSGIFVPLFVSGVTPAAHRAARVSAAQQQQQSPAAGPSKITQASTTDGTVVQLRDTNGSRPQPVVKEPTSAWPEAELGGSSAADPVATSGDTGPGSGVLAAHGDNPFDDDDDDDADK